MIQNRELGLDDYMAMLRRHVWVILIPVVVAPAIGFGISYLFAAKYTSTSTVLVEAPKVPGDYVKPMITEDISVRIMSEVQQVLTGSRLRPVVERVGLAKSREEVDELAASIRGNVDLEPVGPTSMSSSVKNPVGKASTTVMGFTINLTFSNPRQAQQICSEITSMVLEENLKNRQQVGQSTTEFLSGQVEAAKRTLDEQDTKLAAFKRQYVGQLPEDADANLRILMGLNSQLDASTQTVNRAQQDKAYAESVLAQQVTAWKATQSTTSPQALDQQLAALQSQLLQLRSRYTDDYPDVAKAKADIAEVQKRLNEVNSAKPDTSNEKVNLAEPPEIRQIRVQIHQYGQAISEANQEQKRLQEQIKIYQSRVSLSPGVEEQYKKLTRDSDSAQKFYDDLQAKRGASEVANAIESRQQGETFTLLNPASLPDSPSFPNRLMFAGGGLGAGLALGFGLAIWLELKDTAIRNELDVEAVMELPALISLPWLGEAQENKNGKKKLDSSKPSSPSEKETVEV